MNEYTAGEEAYKNGYDAGYKARIEEEEAMRCLFNNAVVCNPATNDCEACGWNPEVSQERLKRICCTLGIPVPGKKK